MNGCDLIDIKNCFEGNILMRNIFASFSDKSVKIYISESLLFEEELIKHEQHA